MKEAEQNVDHTKDGQADSEFSLVALSVVLLLLLLLG
jgi:hypothetical protein